MANEQHQEYGSEKNFSEIEMANVNNDKEKLSLDALETVSGGTGSSSNGKFIINKHRSFAYVRPKASLVGRPIGYYRPYTQLENVGPLIKAEFGRCFRYVPGQHGQPSGYISSDMLSRET
ncbi:MAG: hypothetical protein K6A23_11165 [Butyrivibrio sp.]|nr:hypothetical protein [Butyrivibrio sp.]